MIHATKEYDEIAHKVHKYECIKDFVTKTRILGYDINMKYLWLTYDGSLLIRKKYRCDGASGPTMDDDSNMQAGFMHDGLYQLLRLGKLAGTKKDFNRNRKFSDLSFRDQLKRDGMAWFRRRYYYLAVRWFGQSHALPG